MSPASSTRDLNEMHQRFMSAFNAADLDALAALYEPDALLIPAPGELARGIEEIRSALRKLLAGGLVLRVETTAAFETAPGIALTHGSWTMTGPGPDGQPVQLSGKTAEVLRRQPDGGWKYLIDNPNAG